MHTGKNSEIAKRLYGQTPALFVLFIGFYLIQGAASLFIEGMPPLLDLSAAVILLLLALGLHIVHRFNRTVPICLSIGLFFNIIGLYQIIPYNEYYTGTLYGAPQLGYHYDWICHSVGFGFFAIAFCSAVFPYIRNAFKSYYAIFLLLLLSMLGFGAINEINEFVGYSLLGVGQGFLEFGEGDSSPNKGPWENSCMDLVNNMIGGVIFIGAFVLDKRYSLFSKAPDSPVKLKKRF